MIIDLKKQILAERTKNDPKNPIPLDIKPEDLYYAKNKKLRKDGVEIPLDDDLNWEKFKCFDDPIYFVETYMSVRTATKGIQPLKLRPFQKDLLMTYHTHNRIIVNASRQVGKTVADNAYAIYFAIFNEQQNIWILANKGKTAKAILRRLKIMYESLPLWLQVGIVNWTTESVELENGTTINVTTTTSESARSEDVSLLILDEFGRIKPHIEDDFVTSVFPTVSSDPDTKIIIVSSPRGISNTFYKTCRDAKRKKNKHDKEGINGYVYFEIMWNVVPERDEKWKKKALADLKGDERAFAQEYECSFLGSTKTIVPQKILEKMMPRKPIFEDDHARIFEDPILNHSYAEIVDIAKGTGRTASTIQVIDITVFPFEEVYAYDNKEIDTSQFTKKACEVGLRYNTACIFIENNGIGEAVCKLMDRVEEYPNIYRNEDKKGEIGICTSSMTKEKGVTELRSLLKAELLNINDDKTLGQLFTFIETTKGWGPDIHCLSDLIMPIIHFGYIINSMNIRVNYLGLPEDIYNEKYRTKNTKLNEDEDEGGDLLFVVEGRNMIGASIGASNRENERTIQAQQFKKKLKTQIDNEKLDESEEDDGLDPELIFGVFLG